MPSDEVQRALSTLIDPFADPEMAKGIRARWCASPPAESKLPSEVREAADTLSLLLPGLTMDEEEINELGEIFSEPSAEVLFGWCAESTWRRDTRIAPLLDDAAVRNLFRERVVTLARSRVVEGPLVDALRCAPLIGEGAILMEPLNAEARARLEILFWEAGASAVEVPELAKWLWGSHETFEVMIRSPARGSLRGRVLASRTLEVSVRGLSPATDPELIGKTLQVLQPLLLHPEPLVWVHAARALGRLCGPMEQLEGTVLDWVMGPSPLLRQRAMTAFASFPADRFRLLVGQLLSIIESPQEDVWVLGAIAAATPYLFHERRDIWDRLAVRILRGDGGAIGSRALARGLATLWRRGTDRREIEVPLRALREAARSARATTLDEARRWIEIIAVTDIVDGAERDPLDLELGLENLVRLAAQYDDEEADARASRFAVSLAPTFGEARRIALGTGSSLRHRAAAVNAVEGCARAFALRLWGPLLATRPGDEPLEAPNLEETWKTIARAPAEILDLVKERRQSAGGQTQQNDVSRPPDGGPRQHEDKSLLSRPPDGGPRQHEDKSLVSLEVLAVRLGGYALDACEEDDDLGPGRGPSAHDTCQWLRKLDGLADGSRDLPPALKNALSSLFWRLVDTTRGTALGEVDDVRWLGPFAAWWALVIDRPAMLLQLATSLPMMDMSALESCCAQAEALRTAVSSGEEFGQWGHAAAPALDALHAVDTELTHSLAGLSRALAAFAPASGKNENLDSMCLELVLAADRLQTALADPVRGLHQASGDVTDDSLRRGQTENAPRVAALVARAIRARDPAMLEVWFASLGPVTSRLLEQAVQGAISRTPAPPPAPKKKEAQIIAGYELVKNLGEGGIGTVWLVRKPGADRFFVLKIPKAEALQNATETERAGILASFVEEAKALAGLYHPNVANIIDRGVVENVPYLVLEYLIGADLKQYSAARLMTLFELRQVVLETCAGLAALHSANLVHRDIKPANLWLRLPLGGGEKFDPDKHRDPAHTPPLASVVIDFGMVRAIRVPAEVGGRFVAGTAGYIAPEQVLDPVELDPRSDVYALAGTIYNVTTGRAFFDDIDNPRDRIIAHMRRDPFEDTERLRTYPAAVAKLLRAAVAKEPKDRPSPLEFGREFVAAL